MEGDFALAYLCRFKAYRRGVVSAEVIAPANTARVGRAYKLRSGSPITARLKELQPVEIRSPPRRWQSPGDLVSPQGLPGQLSMGSARFFCSLAYYIHSLRASALASASLA